MTNSVLRLPAVIQRTGLSRSSIYNYIREQRFPAPILLGLRSVGWIEADVSTWIDQRVTTQKNITNLMEANHD